MLANVIGTMVFRKYDVTLAISLELSLRVATPLNGYSLSLLHDYSTLPYTTINTINLPDLNIETIGYKSLKPVHSFFYQGLFSFKTCQSSRKQMQSLIK